MRKLEGRNPGRFQQDLEPGDEIVEVGDMGRAVQF
jgi:hypothetical protein